MQITNITAERAYEGGTHLNLAIQLPGIAVAEAVALVLSRLTTPDKAFVEGLPAAEETSERLSSDSKTALAATVAQIELLKTAMDEPVEEPKAEAPPPATRTRRPRLQVVSSTPAEAPAEEPKAEATPAPTRSRLRPTPEAAPEKPSISDVDLSKAASNAAAKIGQDVVMLVLKDLGVETVGKLEGDARQKFLDEIAEEVRLFEEEQATATA